MRNLRKCANDWKFLRKCKMVKCRKHRKHRRFSRSDGLYWYDTVLVLGGNQIKQNLGDGDLWRTCAKNVTQMKPGDCAGGQRAGGEARADRRQKVDWGSWSWSPTCGDGTRISGEHAHVNCHFSPNNKYVEIIGWTFVKADEKLNYRLLKWLSKKLYLVVILNVKERNLSHGHFDLEAFCFVCNNVI